MAGISQIPQGDEVSVALQISDGATDQHPQAEIRDDDSNLLTTIDLLHTASGLYRPASPYMMPDEIYIIVTYITYDNTGHTTENTLYQRDIETYIQQTTVQSAMTAQGYTTTRATKLDNLDTTISSRAQPGDAMDLIADAVDSTSLAISGIDEIQDAILADSTPFNGANIDTSISSRSSHTADDVDTILSSNHGNGLWDATSIDLDAITDAVWDEDITLHNAIDSAGEYQNRLDEDISSRAIAGDAMDLIADAIDSTTIATSGANEIRDAILADSTPFDGADIATILSDTESLNDTKITTARANNLDNLDASILSRSSHDAADIDTQLSGTHGNGLWDATSTDVDMDAIADAVWDEDITTHIGVNSAGKAQNHLDVNVSSRAIAGDKMDLINDAVDSDTLATSAVDGIRDAILTDSVSFNGADIGAILTDTADMQPKVNSTFNKLPNDYMMGSSNKLSWNDDIEVIYNKIIDLNDTKITTARANNLDNLNAQVSSRSSHSPADINTLLSNNHGNGQWDAVTIVDVPAIADAVWDEDITEHTDVNSAGKAQNRLAPIFTDTNDMQPKIDSIHGKLPDNNIMGSSVKTDKDDEIDAIVADVAELNDTKITTTRASNLDHLDVDISTRSSHTATDIDSLLSTNHGPGQWDATAIDLGAIADSVWDEQLLSHIIPGSTGEAIGDSNSLINSIETTINQIDLTLTLLRKLLSNKSILTKIDIEHYQQKFYDDDSSTVIKTDNITLIGNDEIREEDI